MRALRGNITQQIFYHIDSQESTSNRVHISSGISNTVKYSFPSATVNIQNSKVNVHEKNTSNNRGTDPTSSFLLQNVHKTNL